MLCRHLGIFGLVAALIASMSACTHAVSSREAAELSNISPNHIIGKTSSRRLVSSFETYCARALADLETLPGTLRENDYVEIAAGTGFRNFVADTTAPLIGFRKSEDARHCYVAAEAKTGQQNAIDRMVVTEFPGAAPRSTADLPGVTRAWQVSTTPQRIVYLREMGAYYHRPRIVLGLIES